MIHLNVTLDSTLVHYLRNGGWSAMASAWPDFCRRYSLTDLRKLADFFQCDREPTTDELSLLHDTESFIDSNLQKSIEHITRWLPEIDEDICQPVRVVFLPYGKYTFSPKLGLQFFSLDPYASPIETILFLVHVYYHEMSYLNETPEGRRCSSAQLLAADFKEWIRLLIRNEGIGNHAVLEELKQFTDSHPDYVMRYFTYARKIGDLALLQSAVSILTDVFTAVDDENVAQFRNGINKIFKNESLPILNLVGIHMAESIANHYGVATLKNVYQREAGDFFALYGQTHAPFAETLKGL
jgi:hypothetical protein